MESLENDEELKEQLIKYQELKNAGVFNKKQDRMCCKKNVGASAFHKKLLCFVIVVFGVVGVALAIAKLLQWWS